MTRFEDDPRSPIERFEKLLGQSLDEIEGEWIEHIRTLAEPQQAD